MRKIFMSIMFLFVVSQIKAQMSDTDIANLSNGLLTVERDSIPAFWAKVKELNSDYQSFVSVRNRNTKYYRDVASSFYNTLDRQEMSINQMFEYYADDYKSVMRSIMYDLDLGEVIPKGSLCVLNFKDVNATTMPNGRIFVFRGLADKLYYEEMIAILCHEVCHYVLEHSLVGEYKSYKKAKNNQIVADIAGGLTMGAIAASDMYAASNGVDMSKKDYNSQFSSIATSLSNAAVNDAYYYNFRYSRQQETESDVIAYFLLEYMGIGGEYMISALEKIGYDLDGYYSKESEHPKMSNRIALLKKIDAKYRSQWKDYDNTFVPYFKTLNEYASRAYKEDDYDTALKYFEETYPMFMECGTKMQYASSLFENGRKKEALPILEENKKEYLESHTDMKFTVYYLLYKCYFETDDYERTIGNANMALDYLDDIYSSDGCEIVIDKAVMISTKDNESACLVLNQYVENYIKKMGYAKDDCWKDDVMSDDIADCYRCLSTLTSDTDLKDEYSKRADAWSTTVTIPIDQ